MNTWKTGWVPICLAESWMYSTSIFISRGTQPWRLLEEGWRHEEILFYLSVPLLDLDERYESYLLADLSHHPSITCYNRKEYLNYSFGHLLQLYPRMTRGKLVSRDKVIWEKPMCYLCLLEDEVK